MEFGTRLKEILEEKNISQVAFAKATGQHQGLVSRVLNGEKPSSKFIFKTIDYFPNVDFNYLLGSEKTIAVEEKSSEYKKNRASAKEIINDIERKLNELKQVLPQY